MVDRNTRLLGSVVAAVLLIGVVFLVVSSSFGRCAATLVPLPEPADWRSWPDAKDNAGYVIQGCQFDTRRPFWSKVRLTGPGICGDGRLPLDQWLTMHPPGRKGTVTPRSPQQLTVRASPASDVLVVVGREGVDDAVFVAAYRRDTGRWRRLSTSAKALLAGLILACGALIGGAVRALACGRTRGGAANVVLGRSFVVAAAFVVVAVGGAVVALVRPWLSEALLLCS